MKVDELLENELDELEQLMVLRSTESKISMDAARKVLAWLKSKGYHVLASDGHDTKKNKGLGRRHLKISSGTWKNRGWRSGIGAVERYTAEKFLRDAGYKVARWPHEVAANHDPVADTGSHLGISNSPHVFFW